MSDQPDIVKELEASIRRGTDKQTCRNALAEIRRLRAEVERLKPFEPRMRMDGSGVTVYAAKGFMAHIVQSFDALNGEANYSATEISTFEGDSYEVVVRRHDKPTPHELRKRVEVERDTLRDQLRWRRFGDERPEVGTPVLVWIAGSKKSKEAWVAELAYPNRKLVWRALEIEDEVADDDRWKPITGPEVLDTHEPCCNNVRG